MSCPWWKVAVTFEDGTVEDFVAEGCTPTESITNLFQHPYSSGEPLADAVSEHGDVTLVAVGGMYEPEPLEDRVVEASDVL